MFADVRWWLRGKVDRWIGRLTHWALERLNRD